MKRIKLIVIITLGLILSSCGGHNNSGSANSGPTASAFQSVDQQGYAFGGSFNGHQVISINPVALTLTVSLPLPSAPPNGATQQNISNLPGATLAITQPTATSLWEIDFTIPLKYLVKGVAYQTPATLPNGKPLPGLNTSLPMLTAMPTANGQTFNLYGNSSTIAIFYPTPSWDPGVDATVPISNKKNTATLGYFALVEKDGNFPGGVYSALVFSQALQTALKTVPQN